MNESSSPTNNLLESLRSQVSLLEARNSALVQLSATSNEIYSTLQRDLMANIDEALARREQDCQRYATLCGGSSPNNEAILETVRKAASVADEEVGKLVRSALSLYARSQTHAEEILACQSECEAILKSRLKATAKALRESTQRRKLDAAYGPACKHSTPAFLDRQR